jgi:hypothetical protein
MPRRSLLCLKRNVDEAGAWALGKEFIGILRDQRLPRLKGRRGRTCEAARYGCVAGPATAATAVLSASAMATARESQ